MTASVVFRFLARQGWRKVALDTRHPKSDPQIQEAWEKTPGRPGDLAETGSRRNAADRDHFSRRGSLRADGTDSALLGADSVTSEGRHGYERQFVYVDGAVSSLQGELGWKISPKMNTEQMNQFLAQVRQAHPDEFIVMAVDGASSHRSQELRVPENIRLHRLPGYSQELNPQEHVWDELREKDFPNRVFESMDAVVARQPTLAMFAGGGTHVRAFTRRERVCLLPLL